MALGVSTVPGAQADDLKDKKQQGRAPAQGRPARTSTSRAPSSGRPRARLAAAQTQLADAKTQLATARGKVEVAQERDAEMQAELAAAEAELAAAEAALAQGQVDRETQRQKVANTVADMYSEGDPELIAFSSLLDASPPRSSPAATAYAT